MQIYKITNKINGKFYVGKTTKSLEERWEKHQKYNKCPKLFASIKKYGANNFIIENLEFCNSQEDLNKKEIFWIKKLNAIENGYNLTHGGDGGAMIGEALEKIRLHAKTRIVKESTREKCRKRVGRKNGRSKKVIVTLENKIQIGFYCIKDAAEFLNIAPSSGRSLVRGVYKTISRDIKIQYVEKK